MRRKGFAFPTRELRPPCTVMERCPSFPPMKKPDLAIVSWQRAPRTVMWISCFVWLSLGVAACQGAGPSREQPVARAEPPANLPPEHPAISAGARPGMPSLVHEGIPDDTSQGPLMSGPARAALDSANALFRAKRFALALEKYRLAARLAPKESAPLIGMAMVAAVLPDKRLADSVNAVLRGK